MVLTLSDVLGSILDRFVAFFYFGNHGNLSLVTSVNFFLGTEGKKTSLQGFIRGEGGYRVRSKFSKVEPTIVHIKKQVEFSF